MLVNHSLSTGGQAHTVQCEILTRAPITQPWSSPPVTSSQCPAPHIHIHIPILFSPWPSAPSTVYWHTPPPLLAFLASPLLTHCLQAPPTHPLPQMPSHRPWTWDTSRLLPGYLPKGTGPQGPAEPRECEQSPRQPASFPIGVGRTHSIVLPPENSEASLALVSWCFYYLRLEEGQVQWSTPSQHGQPCCPPKMNSGQLEPQNSVQVPNWMQSRHLKVFLRTSLVVQWLRLPSPARGVGSIPGWGLRFHLPHGQEKKKSIKQKQYCNKSIKDFKNFVIVYNYQNMLLDHLRSFLSNHPLSFPSNIIFFLLII